MVFCNEFDFSHAVYFVKCISSDITTDAEAFSLFTWFDLVWLYNLPERAILNHWKTLKQCKDSTEKCFRILFPSRSFCGFHFKWFLLLEANCFVYNFYYPHMRMKDVETSRTTIWFTVMFLGMAWTLECLYVRWQQLWLITVKYTDRMCCVFKNYFVNFLSDPL